MGERSERLSSRVAMTAALVCGLSVGLTAVGMANGFSSRVEAAEPSGRASVESAEVRRDFAVWCGNCSRSLRFADSCATVAEAARRAGELKKNHLHVVVLQGESNYENAMSVILRRKGEANRPTPWQKCAVHTVGCRLGARELPSPAPWDAAQAEREAAKLREAGRTAVVVYSFARK